METPVKPSKTPTKNNDDNVATTSSLKAINSPKTPVRAHDSSFEDEDTDEMESPRFPHLIPVYHRTPNEYDLEGVRIGWDDGYGCVFYQDDDYIVERKGKRLMRNRLFSERRHRSFFESHKNSSSQNSPSPESSSNVTVGHAELNDYLGCILNFLSAKKRKRQLMKSKSEENSTNNSTENNNISHLLDDSADDEMMLLCSQAIEKTIAADANCTITNKTTSANFLSIPGISPLKDTNDTINNNVYHHAAKKFKPIQCLEYLDKKNDKIQSQCHTITSNSVNQPQHNTSNATNTVTSSNKEISSLLSNHSLDNEDDELFSAIDLSAIEQNILFNENKTLPVPTVQRGDQDCNKPSHNTNIVKPLEKNSSYSTSTVPSNASSLLWRRSSSSSSIINSHSQLQKPISSYNDITTNSKMSGDTESQPATTRYCTPAEIEAKRNRARRTLMLKFKSKNKSAV